MFHCLCECIKIYISVGSECYEGFHLVPGDIPGMGQIEGHGGLQTDDQGCGLLCQRDEDCSAQEQGLTEKLCNLNKDCKPSAEKHLDQNFCVKGH